MDASARPQHYSRVEVLRAWPMTKLSLSPAKNLKYRYSGDTPVVRNELEEDTDTPQKPIAACRLSLTHISASTLLDRCNIFP
eukprot:3686579-Pleurochrysis_carterae.AAC.1